MQKIGLLSDTHGSLPEKIFTFFESCHQIWHAGDIGNIEVLDQLESAFTVKAVFGNIDGNDVRHRTNEIHTEIVEGVKMTMIHIGGYPGKYQPKARDLIISGRPKLFISGHSHILKVMYDKKYKLLHINPGAAGNSGLHQKITLVRFDLENGEIKNLEIFEKDRKR
ncbi:MAG: metallophosphatase family protein [Bacteroidales bacterium]|nr:metallophosphatase family protein [Bacteroidales bacterium]